MGEVKGVLWEEGREKAGAGWTHRRARKSRKAATRAATDTQWPR